MTPTATAARAALALPQRHSPRRTSEKLNDKMDTIVGMLRERRLDTQKGFSEVRAHLDDISSRLDRRDIEVDLKFAQVHEKIHQARD